MRTSPAILPAEWADGQRDAVASRELSELTMRTFIVRADSVDEATRSVEAIIATEDPVTVFDVRRWDAIDEVLRMDGLDIPDQVPLLANHNRFELDAIYGSVRQMRFDGPQLLGRLYFAEGDDPAERAWQKVKQRHIRDISAGYRAMEYTDIDPGQTAVVKGRSYTAGQRTLRVTTRWQLKEGSLVPIGADARAKIRADQESRKETSAVNPQLKAYLVSIGLRAEANDAEAQLFYERLQGEQRTAADRLVTRETTPPASSPATAPAEQQRSETPAAPGTTTTQSPPSPDAIRQQAITDERDRVRRITELAGSDVPAEVAQRAISEGWDVNRASQEFLTAVRANRGRPSGEPAGGPAIHSRSQEVDVNARSLAAGLLMSQGVEPVRTGRAALRMHNGSRAGEALTEQDAERGQRLMRLPALDIVRECVRIDTGRHLLDPEDVMRAAVSSTTFSNVFSTNVNARLIEGWQRAGDTTIGWCDEEDVANFMEQEDISVQANARLERLPRGDTAKHATASDSHETYRIARYAKQFVLDEQDFIDDRLGAHMRIVEEMGEAARMLRPDLVYSLMLENPTLVADSGAVFNSTAVTTAGGHANLGSAVLSSTSLKAAISAMVKQRINRTASKPGEALLLRPRFLIVPADLEWTARELTAAAALSKLFADSSDPFYAQLNLLAQEGLRVVPDDRIGAIGVLDPRTKTVRTGLDTNWFLTAGGSKGMRVAYRRGTGRQPQMRSFTLDRGQWGMGWDINMDIGAAFMDFRPWYKSTGA